MIRSPSWPEIASSPVSALSVNCQIRNIFCRVEFRPPFAAPFAFQQAGGTGLIRWMRCGMNDESNSKSEGRGANATPDPNAERNKQQTLCSDFGLRASFGFRHFPEPPHVVPCKVMNDLRFAFRQLLWADRKCFSTVGNRRSLCWRHWNAFIDAAKSAIRQTLERQKGGRLARRK